MDTFLTMLGAFALVVLVACGVALIMAFPVMLLTNSLIAPNALAAVFGEPHLSFGKALELEILCGLLFKSSNPSSKDKK